MEKMKAATLVPKKFRSVREKNGSHRRNKSAEPGNKVRVRDAPSTVSQPLILCATDAAFDV
jgi:hypothetical protein